MKIPTPELVREADAYTIKNEPVSSIELMERAAHKAFEKILDRLQLFDSLSRGNSSAISFSVFCGPGNNGGDGLVISRLLSRAGFSVKVFLLRKNESDGSEDFKTNLERIKNEKIPFSDILIENNNIEINKNEIIIDAIFGSGLNRPVEEPFLKIIRQINSLPNKVVSIDIPSGLFAEDNSMNPDSGIIKAEITLSFQFPKFSFLLAENDKYVGAWEVIDIGLSQEFIDSMNCKRIFVMPDFVAHQLKPRPRFSHKGTFGHALLVAGSIGKGGAALMAAKALMKSGAGLVTVHIPSRLELMLQTGFPEAMVSLDRGADFIESVTDIKKYDVAGIGPGIGVEKDTANALKFLIQNASFPLVIDADALNIISENLTWLSFLPAGSILTPHPGEFDRMFGKSDSSFERISKQKEISFKHRIYILLKGAFSSFSCPDGTIYFNSTGNPGMAKAGTGDVLTGILTGLIARGYSSESAGVIGMHIHGFSSDLAVRESSMESFVATDIISSLGEAFLILESQKSV